MSSSKGLKPVHIHELEEHCTAYDQSPISSESMRGDGELVELGPEMSGRMTRFINRLIIEASLYQTYSSREKTECWHQAKV